MSHVHASVPSAVKCSFCESAQVVPYIGPGDWGYDSLDGFDVRRFTVFHTLHAEGKDVCLTCAKKLASDELAADMKSWTEK